MREKRFACIKNDRVESIYIQQPQDKSIVGNIYVGQVTRVVPGMNAAFIDIGEEKAAYLQKEKLASFISADGSLEDKRNKKISSYIRQGERVIVQVIKDASEIKGAKVTGIIELAGENMVYMPFGRYIAVSKKVTDKKQQQHLRQFGQEITRAEEGIIFRTSAVKETKENLQNELQKLREKYEQVERSMLLKKVVLVKEKNEWQDELVYQLSQLKEGEVICDNLKQIQDWSLQYPNLTFHYHQQKEDIFTVYGIESVIDKGLKRIVWLENGSYFVIDHAEAAIIIDVNTGKFQGKEQLERTVFQTNQLAVLEIARQIRLRDLAGIILIDFIDMPEIEQKKIHRQMEHALQHDHRQTKVIGFTKLGILQLTRKKTVQSMTEMLLCKCSVCSGTGFVRSPETVAFQLERELWEYRGNEIDLIEIEANKEVIEVFAGKDFIHVKRMEELLNSRICFKVLDTPKPNYSITYVGEEKK